MKAKHKKSHSFKSKPCHKGFTEITENIWVGKEDDITIDLLKFIDVLIPLNSVTGKIWRMGYKGKVKYIPIEDYSVLPRNVETVLVDEVLELIREGKSVAIFCVGGHGRTGYFTSLILGKLGYDDPIGYMRKHYCKNVVESNEQVEAVAEFINKPELITKYRMVKDDIWSHIYREYGYGMDGHCSSTCGECASYKGYLANDSFGYCSEVKNAVCKWDRGCGAFISKCAK